MSSRKKQSPRKVLHEARFLRLVEHDTWEFVERRNTTGIVIIVAVTEERRLVLVEQMRIPVGRSVVELPAGLAGDEPGAAGEALAEAAKRELVEETGYEAELMESLGEGPSSAGLSSEVVTFFRARRLRRTGEGGGVPGEDITVHEVPLDDVPGWLGKQADRGALIDPKVYAALWFASRP